MQASNVFRRILHGRNLDLATPEARGTQNPPWFTIEDVHQAARTIRQRGETPEVPVLRPPPIFFTEAFKGDIRAERPVDIKAILDEPEEGKNPRLRCSRCRSATVIRCSNCSEPFCQDCWSNHVFVFKEKPCHSAQSIYSGNFNDPSGSLFAEGRFEPSLHVDRGDTADTATFTYTITYTMSEE